MAHFLFVPDVDDSLGPLKTWQWILVASSFLASVILLTISISMGGAWGALCCVGLGVTAVPMSIYAQNRSARMVGALFLVAAIGILGYHRFNWATGYPFLALIISGFMWIAWCIDKASNVILRRLDTLEEKLGDIEAKKDELQ